MRPQLKKIAARLPATIQDDMKRYVHRWRRWRGAFVTAEPEYAKLGEWLKEGDWVIDVGANIGHYTHRMSELVGSGRVLAFEPMPSTFALLAGNVAGRQNVTLFNAAVSDRLGIASMETPVFDSGLKDYYESRLTDDGDQTVMTIPVDSLGLPKISLIKVDAEGHEDQVLAGMSQLIARDRPVLIIETVSDRLRSELLEMGYEETGMPGSPNRLFLAGTPQMLSCAAAERVAASVRLAR